MPTGLWLPRSHPQQKPPVGVPLDGANPLLRGIESLLPLNEGGGIIVSSPAAYPGAQASPTATLHGGVSWVAGKGGAALSFDGSSGYVDVSFAGTGLPGVANNYTIWTTVWISSTSTKGTFFNVGSGNLDGFAIGIGSGTFDTSGNNLIGLYNTRRWFDSGHALGTGWHDVALAIDGSGYPTLYLDGAVVYSDTTGAPATATGAREIGQNGSSGRYFGGLVSQAGTWRRALSPAEVQTLYTQPYALLQPQRRLWVVGAGGARAWSGSGSVIETPTTGSARLFVANRAGTVTEHITVTATRTQVAQRAQHVTVNSTPQASHLLSLIRSSNLTATTSAAASRALAMGRSATTTLTPSLSDLRILVMPRIAAIIETPAPTVSRLLSLTRVSGLTTTPGTTASRAMTLGRVAATTLSASLTALRSATMARAAAVTETPTVTASRLQATLRSAGTAISAVIGATSSLQHAGTFVYSLAVTLAPAVTSSRALVMSRVQTTAVSATMLGSRLATSLRAGSTALSPAVTGARAVQALRSASSTLTPNPGTSHLLSLLRGAGSSLTATITATRALTLLRVGASRITAIASALGSGSFSPPLVQIAAWAASRARKGIEELVLAYQSIQSHLGHTQDTQANFDAGFTTFSGAVVAPPDFPDPAPLPEAQTDGLDAWVQSRLRPGNYESVTAFAALQRVANNYAASSTTYDALYAAFTQEQEPASWPH